jgi:hypothetical protein
MIEPAEGDFVSRRGDHSCSAFCIIDIPPGGSLAVLRSDTGDEVIVARDALKSAYTAPVRMEFMDDRPGFSEAVSLSFTRYRNNDALAIILTAVDDGQPYMTASVNRPDIPLAPNQVFIKDYDENAGITGVLIHNGIIEPTPLPSGAYELTPAASLVALLQQNGDLKVRRSSLRAA